MATRRIWSRLFGRTWSFHSRKPRRVAPRTRLFAAALEAREVPAVYTVTSLGDSGLNTLRNAINSANTSVGADTINITVSGTITLTTGSLDITDAVTIVGPGVSQLTIKNGATDRIFNTSGAAAKSAISLSGMTITGGKPAGGGGGIFVNDEALTLNNCKVSGNVSQADGGAILVGGLGSLTLGNCTITGNTANGANSEGGGLAFSDAANVVISQSLISGNIAGSDGGGIYFFKNGTLLMDASAVINNETAGDGAGIYAFGASFTGNIYNTTISGNTTSAAGHSGGGIMLKGLATLNLKNSTVVENTATTAGGGAAVVSGTLNLDSTVVASNKATTGAEISGTVNSAKSFIGVTTGATVVGTALTGNPQLSLLGFWGGPQPGYKPLVGSPLINAGANPAGLAFDQRGVSRTIGAGTDIGSIEFSDTLYVTNTSDSGAGSLRRAVDDSNIDSSIDTITFDPTLFATPQKLSLFSEIDVTDSVVVQGPGNVTVNAVGVGRHFNIDGANKLDVTLSGMTLFNGKVASGNGGAVRIADENVTLSQMTLIGNSAPAGAGGAIAVESSLGKLQLDDCVSSGNSAGQNGG
ncbi:MAG: right-handed parallel beta-helix repeat-containing protein, partial [Gemmataceae bacterium]|nr:right-handed parallel beta-helix repeat-containing protein [Gemmataceae bacterium]